MDKSLLHTPEGVRDIYNGECAKKLALQDMIHTVFSSYGYFDIQTPTFEFFDIFNKERGSVASKDMYKFFDREGHTLVLRPDMTPSIARCVAKYYMNEEMPVRLCYIGNTFINNSEHQGKLKEVTQMGCEFVGDNSSDADAEMIALVIDSLLKTGLEEFQVEIGQVDFFRGLLEEAGIDHEAKEELRHLIEIKNNFGVEQLLENFDLPVQLKEVFLKLPELFGNAEILEVAKTLTTNKRALKAITRLEKVYSILSDYQLEKFVSFDLGMLSNYNYYTGIIFKGYTYGIGDAVVTGGRYDDLLKQFGKVAPSVGFGINIDRLMIALGSQKIDFAVRKTNTMLLYKTANRKKAIALANLIRADGGNVELVRKRTKYDIGQYKEYAKRENAGGILYLENADLIQKISLYDDTIDTMKLSALLGTEE